MKNFINLILATIIMPAYLIADESDEPASPPKAEEVEVKENESEEEVVENETEDEDEDENDVELDEKISLDLESNEDRGGCGVGDNYTV